MAESTRTKVKRSIKAGLRKMGLCIRQKPSSRRAAHSSEGKELKGANQSHRQSIPLDDSSTSRRRPDDNLQDSTLLRLPTEIRLEILKYCLDGNFCSKTQWVLAPERYSETHFRTIFSTVYRDYVLVPEGLSPGDWRWMVLNNESAMWNQSYTFYPQVLRACHQLYREGKSILYGRNDFVVVSGVPADPRGGFMRLGEGSSWHLSPQQYKDAFPVLGNGLQVNKGPAMTLQLHDMKGLREPTEIHMVLVQDLRMVMSSLQRSILWWHLPRPYIQSLDDGPMMAFEIHRASLPGLGRRDGESTSEMSDMIFPWIVRWMDSRVNEGEYVQLGLFNEHNESTPLMFWPPSQTKNYPPFANWHRQALLQQLNDLREQFEASGPSRAVIQQLWCVIQQAMDALIAMEGVYVAQDDDGGNPFHRIIAIAAWFLASLDISAISDLSNADNVAIRRCQVLHALLATSFEAPRAFTTRNWLVNGRLRIAILLNELGITDLATDFLELAVLETMPANDLDNGNGDTQAWIDQHLLRSLKEAGIPKSVGAKGYARRGRKPSDFPLLVATWAWFAGIDYPLHPVIPETAAMRLTGLPHRV